MPHLHLSLPWRYLKCAAIASGPRVGGMQILARRVSAERKLSSNHTNMNIGYARVSTDEQHLDLQLSALNSAGCEVVFSDQGISGARFDRPGLRAALDALKHGDTLTVWKLDRLGRSLGSLVSLITELNQRGAQFVSLTEAVDTQSSAGRFTFHMIAALAEFERALISERTRAGMAAARERGRRFGRPVVLDHASLEHARALLADQPLESVAAELGVHKSTLRRKLRTQPIDGPLPVERSEPPAIISRTTASGHAYAIAVLPVRAFEGMRCANCIDAFNGMENVPHPVRTRRVPSGTSSSHKKPLASVTVRSACNCAIAEARLAGCHMTPWWGGCRARVNRLLLPAAVLMPYRSCRDSSRLILLCNG